MVRRKAIETVETVEAREYAQGSAGPLAVPAIGEGLEVVRPAGPAPAPRLATPRAWVVVTTKTGQELVAKANLMGQVETFGEGFEVYLPMRLFENARRETCSRPFLPGYLFAKVTALTTDWRALFSTRGVRGVLGVTSQRTLGLKDEVVERIRAREDAGFIRLGLEADGAPKAFVRGQKVRWDDMIDGMFMERVDRNRGLILVSLFGRDSPQLVDLRKLTGPGEP
jgi:transcription antitermination factor NusG